MLLGGGYERSLMNDFTGRHSQKNAAMKSHHSVILISSATRIRTWKMLESESSALPFGDSATTCVIIADRNRFVNRKFEFFY